MADGCSGAPRRTFPGHGGAREGRLIAVLLMVIGIGVIGIFTATVASFLLEHGQDAGSNQVETRLQAIEEKLEQLLRESRRQ